MDKRYWWYLFVCSVTWGTSYPLTKVLLAKITPLTFLILRLTFGLVVLLLMVARRKSWSEFGHFWRQDRRVLLVLGLVITPGSLFLQSYAILFTTAVNQSIIINLQAIIVVIIQVVFYKLRLRPTVWIGSVIAFFGVYLIIVRPGEVLFGISTFLGDILTILTSIGWGAYTAVGEKAVRKFDPLVVISAIFACCLAIFIPLWIVEGGYAGLLLLGGWEWLMLVYLGVICTGFGYWIWYEACRSVPAEQVAMFSYVSPLVAIVMGVAWLGEPFTLPIVIGFALTMVGLTIAERSSLFSSKGEQNQKNSP